MPSAEFDNLTAEFPQEREAIVRLLDYIQSGSSRSQRVLPLKRLFEIAHPSSQFALVQILSELVEQGLIEKIIRVESSSLGGIQDFPSIEEVPSTINDWRTGATIEVQPENLQLYYKL